MWRSRRAGLLPETLKSNPSVSALMVSLSRAPPSVRLMGGTDSHSPPNPQRAITCASHLHAEIPHLHMQSAGLACHKFVLSEPSVRQFAVILPRIKCLGYIHHDRHHRPVRFSTLPAELVILDFLNLDLRLFSCSVLPVPRQNCYDLPAEASFRDPSTISSLAVSLLCIAFPPPDPFFLRLCFSHVPTSQPVLHP